MVNFHFVGVILLWSMLVLLPTCLPPLVPWLFPGLLHSTSGLRALGSSLAPRSLCSTRVRRSSDSAGLPRPSGTALVSLPCLCHDLPLPWLHLVLSFLWLRLFLPSGSTLVLCCTSFTMAHTTAVSTVATQGCGSALALQISGVSFFLSPPGSPLPSDFVSPCIPFERAHPYVLIH